MFATTWWNDVSSRLRFDPEGGKSMPKGENTPVERSPQNTTSKTSISRRSFLKGTGAGAAGLASVGFQIPFATAEEQNAVEAAVGPDPIPMTLRVNDRTYTLRLEPRVTLASALRDHLDLGGTKLFAIVAPAADVPCYWAVNQLCRVWFLLLPRKGKPFARSRGWQKTMSSSTRYKQHLSRTMRYSADTAPPGC